MHIKGTSTTYGIKRRTGASHKSEKATEACSTVIAASYMPCLDGQKGDIHLLSHKALFQEFS
jgi:hypothetical protein